MIFAQMNDWIEWGERVGWPALFLLGLFAVLWRICNWAKPIVEGAVNRWVKSQEKNAENLGKLTDKSIEVQELNSDTMREFMSKSIGMHEESLRIHRSNTDILAKIVKLLNGNDH